MECLFETGREIDWRYGWMRDRRRGIELSDLVDDRNNNNNNNNNSIVKHMGSSKGQVSFVKYNKEDEQKSRNAFNKQSIKDTIKSQ